MNGPEHYTEAERLLNLDAAAGLPGGPVRMEQVAAAQVHATLALVAAASESTYRAGDRERWAAVLTSKEEA